MSRIYVSVYKTHIKYHPGVQMGTCESRGCVISYMLSLDKHDLVCVWPNMLGILIEFQLSYFEACT